MTATMNGTGAAVTRDIAAGTRVRRLTDGFSATFVAWVSGGECANVRRDDTGGIEHVCDLQTADAWQVTQSVAPDDPREVALAELQIELEQMTAARDQAVAQRNDDQATAMRAQEDLDQRVTALVREKTAVEVDLATARREVEQGNRRMTILWERLGEEADRRDWCGEYDDFAEANGGPRRREDIEAFCTVNVRSVLEGSDLISAIGADDLDEIDVENPEVEINWTFEMPSRNHTVRTGSCACDSVDWPYAIEMQLRNIRYVDFEIDSRRCDNDA